MVCIVHTQRRSAGIHFVYQVNVTDPKNAFDALCIQGAIDSDETHVETVEALEPDRSHELIAIVKTKLTIQ